MPLSPGDITIAVTVFSRREFVFAAVSSALNQSPQVKVIVVEDCGPDAKLRDDTLRQFGNRIEYFRNPRNRGLFDNWNACIEYCRTPWLSILHDDDALNPNFSSAMIDLERNLPGRSIYFGRAARLAADGKTHSPPPVSWPGNCREIDVRELADECFLIFPGQLFRVADAQSIGGFRKESFLTGDWDFWFRMALKFGAAQTSVEVAVNREHEGKDRGSTRVERMGWKWALDNLQRKRNYALLKRETGQSIPFDRSKPLSNAPISSRMVLRHANNYSRRMLRYNWWLFTHSRAPNAQYALLQTAVRWCGPASLRLASRFFGGRS
jgi:glycosyltransferase involved in cell wall biosynthesis